ncbi:hypothetical protein, partial [Aeromonas salmonicida]|uniref:hypothetical protein n=1 Tax=Aeromonas salmonicida TaxID=645 RepID=UPI003D01A78A
IYLVFISAVIINIINENKTVFLYKSSVIGKPVTLDANNNRVGQKIAIKKGSTNLTTNFLFDT